MLLIVIKVLNDRSNYTPSDKIFKGNKDLINKILLYQGDNSIELLKENDNWIISGNDSLVIKENRIDDFLSSDTCDGV